MKEKILVLIGIMIIIGIMVAIYIIENLYPEITVEWIALNGEIKKDLNGDGIEETINITQEQVANNPIANIISLFVNEIENKYRTIYSIDSETPIGFIDINSDGLLELIVKVKSIEDDENNIPEVYYRIFNYEDNELHYLKTINRRKNEIYFKITNNRS